jgi:hypothetical protein
MSEKRVTGVIRAVRRVLVQRPVVVVAALFFAAVAAILAHVQGLQSHLVSTQALQNAELLTEAVAEFRTVYTSEVVERIRPSGIEITHDYDLREGAAPLPATLSMILGNRIGALGSGVESRLYSAYPFPWATDDGGLPDVFAREAWEALTQNPDEPFYRFETMGERDVLRYATADRMRPACVNCHNTHPDSPKVDWKVGDVRGVLEVITPLDAPLEATRSGLVDTAVLMLVLAAIGVAVFGLLLSDLQEATLEAAALKKENRRTREQVEMENSEHPTE